MPELPEVETITRQLNKNLKGEIIEDFWTDSPYNLKGTIPVTKLHTLISGKKVLKIERRGKNILIFLSQNWVLWIHLKLTGHLLLGDFEYRNNQWQPKDLKGPLSDPQNRFLHWVFFLKSGKKLALSDRRNFAKIVFLTTDEVNKAKELNSLGIEPLSPQFNQKYLEHLLAKTKKDIKKVLMDQQIISGIGNIYANEILWEAQINPFKKASDLTQEEIKNLLKATKKILTLAIKYEGTSAKDEAYRRLDGKKGSYASFLKVYQKEGQPCPRCGSLIKRAKTQGRSTFYCPYCQK